MPRHVLACWLPLWIAGTLCAQTLPPPREPISPSGIKPASASLNTSDVQKPISVEEAPGSQPNFSIVKFDPQDVVVRMVDGRWQLWSGRQMLKDFGSQQIHAAEARKMIAELKLTEHGRLGAPQPAMEFWLSNGQAPPLTSSSRTVIPFDPASLKVESVNGAYWVRDRSRMLYNFGPHRADAQQGLKLLQQFGFNEIAFIGYPNPSMSYPIKNDQSRLSIGKNDPLTVQTLPQSAPRYPLQLFRLGTVGEREPFDALKLELRRESDGWHLVAGIRDLGSLGSSEHSARTALQVVQSYPFTELCRIGSGSMTFFLSRGAAPRGAPLGVRRTPFNPQTLAVKPAGNTQQIVDGTRIVAQLAVPPEEAKTAVKVLQYYQFDCLCEVGQLRYFAKER